MNRDRLEKGTHAAAISLIWIVARRYAGILWPKAMKVKGKDRQIKKEGPVGSRKKMSVEIGYRAPRAITMPKLQNEVA